jgi:hypothetical protein
MARRIRIVVGEGRTAQRGLLRFVLEGEGFDVVGEAKGSADLSGVVEQQRPDVVVLDDGIGVMAVSTLHEVYSQAKIVLVWPSAVVPIGGDARVEPAKILRDLAPAVEQVVAAGAGLTETFERPDWIDKVRKDPATLRDRLGGAKEIAKRPSVTNLQRRTKRLHPTGPRSETTGQERREKDVPAPLVVLPFGDGGSQLEPVLDIGGGGSAGTGLAEETVEERSEWNRRLGTLALSGAAAVSALVLAIALGGGRIPVSGVRGEGPLPVDVPGWVLPGSGLEGPSGVGRLGGSGLGSSEGEEPGREDQEGNGGVDGDLATPGTSGGSGVPAPDGPGDGGTGGGPGDGGTGGGPGDGGTGGGPGDGGTGGGPGDGGTGGGPGDGGSGGGGGWRKPDTGMPGKSGEHNPHGGPPSKLDMTPAHGPGLGASVAQDPRSKHSHAPNHSNDPKHSHKPDDSHRQKHGHKR